MLLLVNKQDISGALDEAELVNRLDLEVLVNEQKCPTRVEASCAIYDEAKIKDPGIQEGFNWLIGLISRDFDELHQRVEKEMLEQKKQEEKEQAERMQRVRRIREERERLAENQAKEEARCNAHEEDDDVVIGNPFKPCNVIRAELEEREKNKNPELTTPTVKVIHVSPTNSVEASNREEIILHPQPLNQHMVDANNMLEKTHNIPMEMCNGSSPVPLSGSEEDRRKKAKKSKKRFKNRVMPEVLDSACISHVSRLNELPPLRPSIETIANGQPSVYMSPKRSSQNGKINWALAEELEPCKET
ncbi:ADP-ribosylation factor-like protein 13B, partial [Stegodyphus mimosarum]